MSKKKKGAMRGRKGARSSPFSSFQGGSPWFAPSCSRNVSEEEEEADRKRERQRDEETKDGRERERNEPSAITFQWNDSALLMESGPIQTQKARGERERIEEWSFEGMEKNFLNPYFDNQKLNTMISDS